MVYSTTVAILIMLDFEYVLKLSLLRRTPLDNLTINEHQNDSKDISSLPSCIIS